MALRATDGRQRRRDSFVKRSTRLIGTVARALYLFMYAPIVVVVAYSFNAARDGFIWKGFSWQWYEKLLANETALLALETP